MPRFKLYRNEMGKIRGIKMIKMEIRKCLPEELTYQQKLQILEEMAEEYRTKSRKEVYGAANYDPEKDFPHVIVKDK